MANPIRVTPSGTGLLVHMDDGTIYQAYKSAGNTFAIAKAVAQNPTPNPDPGPNPEPGDGSWQWPFKYSQYVAQSGDLGYLAQFNPKRKNPVTGRITAHQGLDFGVGGINGKPIPSAHDGVVEISASAASPYFGYGAAILIRHPDGTACLYAHRQAKMLNVGDTVKKGQTIGNVGSTGQSTGPHLHWETWEKNGAKVNPRDFMKARGAPEQ